MKHFILLLMATIVLPSITHAQLAIQGNTCDEIIELEKSFALAIQSQDTLLTKMYQADNYFLAYTIQGMPIQFVPKQHWLSILKDYKTESFTIDDIKVNVYGNTAIAMLMFTQIATVREQDRSGQFVLSDIWVKEDKGWKIAERHSSQPGRNVNMQSK